jgi:hypothetical protein
MAVRVDLHMDGFEELKRTTLKRVEKIPLDVGVDAEANVHKITGLLALSIGVDHVSENVWSIHTGPGDGGRHYGAYEELGTRYRPPHPYLRPACYQRRSL